MSYQICEDEWIDPVCDDGCEAGGETEAGRVRSVAFLNQTAYDAVKADPENATVWAAQKTAGNIKIVPHVRGSFDGGTPVEVDGFGDQATRAIGYDMILNFSDPVYAGNYPFYNSIANKKSLYVAFKTESQSHLSDAKVSTIPRNPVEEDINSAVLWQVEVRFRQPRLVKPFDTPAGVFEC